MLSGALFEAASHSYNNWKECLSYQNNIFRQGFVQIQGKKCIFFHYALRWQVSGVQGDSRLEFEKESGTRCCQGITPGLFCSLKVICLLIIVLFILHQPCESWALGLHASFTIRYVFFFSYVVHDEPLHIVCMTISNSPGSNSYYYGFNLIWY